MVVLFETYLQHREHKAMALTMQIQRKTFKRYVDDSHARFTSKHHVNTFQELLKKQDLAIQYTIEYENENKSLIFVDINITNTINNKYKLEVHPKKTITNIHIKPTSCIDLTSSKVYSKVSFTEHTKYAPRNILKKKKNF